MEQKERVEKTHATALSATKQVVFLYGRPENGNIKHEVSPPPQKGYLGPMIFSQIVFFFFVVVVVFIWSQRPIR